MEVEWAGQTMSITNNLTGVCVFQAKIRESCKEKFRTLQPYFIVFNDD